MVVVEPGEQVRFIKRFPDYADPDSPYIYHCHILDHEDAGMMGQFGVLPEPGVMLQLAAGRAWLGLLHRRRARRNERRVRSWHKPK